MERGGNNSFLERRFRLVWLGSHSLRFELSPRYLTAAPQQHRPNFAGSRSSGVSEVMAYRSQGLLTPRKRASGPEFSVLRFGHTRYLTVRPNGADHQWKEDPSM